MVALKNACFLSVFKRYTSGMSEMETVLMFPSMLCDIPLPNLCDLGELFRNKKIHDCKSLHAALISIKYDLFLKSTTKNGCSGVPNINLAAVSRNLQAATELAREARLQLEECDARKDDAPRKISSTIMPDDDFCGVGVDPNTVTSNDDFVRVATDFSLAVAALESVAVASPPSTGFLESCGGTFGSAFDLATVKTRLGLPEGTTWAGAYKYLCRVRDALFRTEVSPSSRDDSDESDMTRRIADLHRAFAVMTDLSVFLMAAYREETVRSMGDVDDMVGCVGALAVSNINSYVRKHSRSEVRRPSWSDGQDIDIFRYNPAYYDKF